MNYNLNWINDDMIYSIIEKNYIKRDVIKRLYSLSRFWNRAYICSSYSVNNKWAEIIKLSSYGEYIVNKHFRKLRDSNLALLYFCLFRQFHYNDILISIDDTDIDSIEELLNEEIINHKILFPYIFRRILYDKFNIKYLNQQKESISEKEIVELINNTPQGIYQLDNYIIGPYGLLTSIEHRYCPPTLVLPLWHCPDPGCKATHNVSFLLDEGVLQETEIYIMNKLYKSYGNESDWEHVLSTTFYSMIDANRELKIDYMDLGALLEDCFSESEVDIIFERIIKSSLGEIIREHSSNKDTSIKKLLELNSYKKLQLLLLLSDKNLIYIIEQCIDDHILEIPIGQLRHALHVPKMPSISSRTELSCYGFRAIDLEPSRELFIMIKKTYEYCNLLYDLLWKLRINSADELEEALFSYFKANEPKNIIENLVISNKAICDSISKQLNINIDPLANRDIFINRLLWRQGYEPKYRNLDLELFEDRIAKFQELVLGMEEPLSESNREEIRSIGVNLFVSVEDFLEKVVTYNVWFLSSDHYCETNFEYDHAKARKCVSKLLGKTITDNGISFNWEDNGNNTLGTLLCYLNYYLKWVKSLSEIDKNSLIRPLSELPHYAKRESSKIQFHFLHKQFWADCDISMIDQYTTSIDQIYKHLAQSNLAYIRNGLDHKRNIAGFPQVTHILSCITHLNQAFIQAKKTRLYPDPLWLSNYNKSNNGIEEYSLTNSNKLSVILYGPSNHIYLSEPEFSYLYLVSPNRMGFNPNSYIIFRYRETNEYDDYWCDYPRFYD